MEASNELPVRVRPAVEGDVNFIFSSWLKSYRNSLYAKQMSNTVFFTEHHKVIEDLLKTSTTFVLCSSKNSGDLYGYICAEKIDGIFVIHYLYIKHTFRQMGLAKYLLNHFDHDTGSAGMCTHLTKISEKIAPKYGFVYSPYIALSREYAEKREKQLEKTKQEDMEVASEVPKRDES